MNVNINHPSFISFLNQVTTNILSNISIEKYFNLTPEKKLNAQYIVFKLLKSSVKIRATMTDTELRSFIIVLWKKSEDKENYEFAAILNDINKNFTIINELQNPKKRTNKLRVETK
jgi:hypothetical protein